MRMLLIILCLLVSQESQAGEPITVDLLSGRTFTALIDPKTDAEQLWLRWERGTAVLQRPIHWDRVVRAKVAGEEVTGKELQQIVVTIRQDMPVPKKSNIIRLEPSPRTLSGARESYAKPYGQRGQYNLGPNAQYNRYSRATGTVLRIPSRSVPSMYNRTNSYGASNSYGRYGP